MKSNRRRNICGRCAYVTLGLSHMLLAATVVIVLFYGIKHSDNHSILCTFGLQLCSGLAILSSELWSGDQRRYGHITVHIIGFILAVAGILVLDKIKVPDTIHGIAGYTGIVCTLVNAVTAPISYCIGNCWWWMHVLIGLIAFIASSTSLGIAIFMDAFKNWTGEMFSIIILVFIVLYTLDVTLTCLSRLFGTTEYQ